MNTPHPFLKWAGGKRTLLPVILDLAPKACVNYFEPFLGGGSVFFALRGEGRIQKLAHLNDVNVELIATYRSVRDDTDAVIKKLKVHAKKHSKEYFYKQRSRKVDHEPVSVIAARMIYLNRTCFNGLYRVNKAGEFNVPFGDYVNPKICDEENLRACASAAHKARFTSFDFEKASLDRAIEGDFVYFDPPYMPRLGSEFTSYAKGGFGIDEHIRLRDLALKLKARGVSVMISNSGAESVYELYRRGFKIREVKGIRSVGADAATRGHMPDVLIT